MASTTKPFLSMTLPLDITDKEALSRILSPLTEDTLPIWGKMTSQQMVEHLLAELEFTNRKNEVICDLSEDEAREAKQKWIYTDAQIPRNLVLVTLPTQYRFEDIETATKQLFIELDGFIHYFSTPGRISIHPGYGPMNYAEWLIWHGKHFDHHFRQFGLRAEPDTIYSTSF